MNSCRAFLARLRKSGVVALVFWALITIPSLGLAHQGKTLKDALEKDRYSLSIENGQLAGTGTPVLKTALSQSQFILVGEDHGIAHFVAQCRS